MKRILLSGVSVVALVTGLNSQVAPRQAQSYTQPLPAVTFTENKGQVADQNGNPRPDVQYSGTTSGMGFHLRNNGISYQLNRVDSWKIMDLPAQQTAGEGQQLRTADQITTYRVDLSWTGVSTASRVITEQQLPGTSTYYYDVCPNGISGVRTFESVIYKGIYDHIDLHYYSTGNTLKYDFIVAPGGNYKDIRAVVEGATAITVQKDGSLLYTTPLGNISEGAPVVLQNGRQLAARWVVNNNTLQFEIDNYDPQAELIIDPATRTWGTYYGGTGADYGYRCRTDASGNIFLTGWTTSGAGIATAGSYQSTSAGNNNIYLAKFNSAGVRQWGTYVGGNASEQSYGCAVDASGNVYICGDQFTAGNVIASPGCHQATFGGGTMDAFVMKFDSGGLKLWGTHYGGTGDERAYSCSSTPTGDVYITGYTTSNAPAVFTTAGCHQAAYGGGTEDGFVAKFNAAGVRQWGTYYGGGFNDRLNSCAVDASGNVFLVGWSLGGALTSAGSHQPSIGGVQDCIFIKLNASGVRQWATYYGGTGNDLGNDCATDASGNVYFCGNTIGSTGTIIATAGSHQPALVSGAESFLVKFNANGVRQWGTYYGGSGVDQGYGCATDAAGNVYYSGLTTTTTANVISTAGSHQEIHGGGNDAFLVQFNSAGVRQWGTYYGGSGTEVGYSVNIDPTGIIVMSGYTNTATSTAIATAGCHQSTSGGSDDAYLVTFFVCNSATPPSNTTAPANLTVCYNTGTTLSAGGSGTVGWYSSMSGGTYLGGGSTFTTGNLTSTTSYYVQDSSACAVSPRTQITVTVNPPLTSSMTAVVNVSCNGGSNGSATVVAGGGTGPYTYSWAPSGGNAASISGRTAGVYTCTITDNAGCTRTQTVSLTQPSALTSTVTSQTNLSCNGGNNGAATVSPSGGTPGYTYAWAPAGGNAATATGLTATNYTCTITDANGCTRQQTVTLTQPTAIASSVSSQSNVSCNGGNNGAATLSVSGGTPGYTYAWSPSGGNAVSISGRTAGIYTCTITDAAGCTRTQTVNITQPSALTSSISSQSNISCNGGTNGSATVLAGGGAGGYTYSWAPSGGTAATATGLSATSYTCTITDANGCTRTQSVTLTQPTAVTSSVSSQTNVSCNGGNNGAATVNVSGGTPSYTYSWAPSGGTGASISGRTAGVYTCTITDNAGCTRTQTVNLTQPSALTSTVTAQTNVSCNGGNNGAATVGAGGGTPGYTYAWAPAGGNAATATGLSAATYTCTITDLNGCTRTQTVSLTQPAGMNVNVTAQTNVSCNGGNNGAATLSVTGGAGGYTYAWAPSGGNAASVSGRTAGVYTCTITDANSCTTTQTVNITQPNVIAVTVASQGDITCNGADDGTATLSVSGGSPSYTYAWSPSGGTASTASGLAPGTYTCTITDANTCTQTQTVVITEPAALSAAVSSQTDPLCNGGTDGSAAVSAAGGTGILNYSWTPAGGTNANATGIGAGTYTCTVTDANGCTTTSAVTLSEPDAIDISATSQTDVTCNNGNNGSVSIFVFGGTGSYTYSWSPSGGNSTTESGLTAGSYTCVVTDANACTSNFTVNITEPGVIAFSQTVAVCSGDSYTVGNSTYTVTGIYTDVLTAMNGCDSTVTTDLTIENPIDISTTVNGNTATANQNGATYQWIDCLNGNAPVAGETNQFFTPQVTGDYAVIVTMGICSDTSSCTNVITGVESVDRVAFNVYPNPTNGMVSIQLADYNPNITIEIFNSTGQLVRTEKPMSSAVNIELPEENGMYLVRITSNAVSTTKKIIKE